MANTIKVTPQQMVSQAHAISDSINRIERKLQNIEDAVNASKNYWEGDASNKHQEKYKSMQQECKTVVKELKAHPRNLMQIVNLYNEYENANKSIAQNLTQAFIS